MGKRKCRRILHATDLLKGIAGRGRKERDGAGREAETAERLITVCSLNAEKRAMVGNPEHGPKGNQAFFFFYKFQYYIPYCITLMYIIDLFSFSQCRQAICSKFG